ncbi:DUF5105 domain-containing protein [Clostridium gelidum]|uniref:DUF5105 domain-containing protein n=1 Tax=Clostridium gelidum TaxID=704125 RepID=A0ABM7SZN8_9CLOT|nr:hypothetical protein [Clostridium gelidum]BCZ44942.1 DUF5105 domain-containing protein [Clostridium gelidum]
MKNKKFTALLLITMLLLSCVVTGCGKEFTAKESAQIYWELGSGDISNISKINMKEEDAKADIEKNKAEGIKTLKTQYAAQGLTSTDEQMTKILDAANELVKKATVTIEEVSNDGKAAQIKYKTTYVDMTKLGTKAGNDALESVKALGLTDQKQAMDKYSELSLENLANELKNATFSEDTKEKNYTFTKKDKFWVPEGDQKQFIQNLGQLVAGQA